MSPRSGPWTRTRSRAGQAAEAEPTPLPEAFDAGPLGVLLADPDVTDVLVNAPGEVWVDRAGRLERTGVVFRDEESVRRLAVRLASASGRRLDAAVPFADARMPDGTRVHAALHPVALGGTSICLRRPPRRPFTLAGLIEAGGLAPGMAALLGAVVEARLATVVTGATGAGKTTLLSALIALAPEPERVVVVEDTAELVVHRPGVVRLEARTANVEGAGAISLRDLVRQALRMRPDRLVVGEVRGAEVVDLLVALNTGHTGGLSTVHANSPRELPQRLEALGALAGIDRTALHSLLGAGIDVAVHLHRDRDGTRRVSEIGVALLGSDGIVRVVPALIARGMPAAPAPGSPPAAVGACASPAAPGCVPCGGHGVLRHLLAERGVQVPPVNEPEPEPATGSGYGWPALAADGVAGAAGAAGAAVEPS